MDDELIYSTFPYSSKVSARIKRKAGYDDDERRTPLRFVSSSNLNLCTVVAAAKGCGNLVGDESGLEGNLDDSGSGDYDVVREGGVRAGEDDVCEEKGEGQLEHMETELERRTLLSVHAVGNGDRAVRTNGDGGLAGGHEETVER